jgi:hypothetical protein
MPCWQRLDCHVRTLNTATTPSSASPPPSNSPSDRCWTREATVQKQLRGLARSGDHWRSVKRRCSPVVPVPLGRAALWGALAVQYASRTGARRTTAHVPGTAGGQIHDVVGLPHAVDSLRSRYAGFGRPHATRVTSTRYSTYASNAFLLNGICTWNP